MTVRYCASGGHELDIKKSSSKKKNNKNSSSSGSGSGSGSERVEHDSSNKQRNDVSELVGVTKHGK